MMMMMMMMIIIIIIMASGLLSFCTQINLNWIELLVVTRRSVIDQGFSFE
jgi:outer membrane lipoprotein-sorting protein